MKISVQKIIFQKQLQVYLLSLIYSFNSRLGLEEIETGYLQGYLALMLKEPVIGFLKVVAMLAKIFMNFQELSLCLLYRFTSLAF